ncbi:MAG: hypothetical protein A2600_06345 [Candidatus Lambdaproteobacteria bacterium RIFOXYD1_FULL_56_27]|uniref:Uncharacterized protein n=1 Tax=Candidatus Lambdaproteobacteria bacterium RIFOXYD2_FULL_56_26 TaxID=1817773 RepID=A0A1F6H0G1_9PROT|nr:MAG: hypothetical protein A2426_00945 [Candidatus Lambdaproteobacteria bacterium RIFOXYC1_FULL_56_13]OGH03829.1 MAG: hypothetical protein A2557_11855 [Candidatus Lambdaproteobacteria bacterium RIFOXYD2_FULL_56_26]OGH08957.1 MAG: hypothetical protein A2600_06345 [Candidatus Lambdaproteobacteria bacterium RIFOXYD1_FULL_56_27]
MKTTRLICLGFCLFFWFGPCGNNARRWSPFPAATALGQPAPEAHPGHDDHEEEPTPSEPTDSHSDENPQEHAEKAGHDDHEGEFEPGAIEAVEDEGERFRLSPAATDLLNIQTQAIGKSREGWFVIPDQALLQYQQHQGLYLWEDRWATLVKVQALKEKDGTWRVRSSQLTAQSKIVTQGVAWLRICQLQGSGQGGSGHGH